MKAMAVADSTKMKLKRVSSAPCVGTGASVAPAVVAATVAALVEATAAAVEAAAVVSTQSQTWLRATKPINIKTQNKVLDSMMNFSFPFVFFLFDWSLSYIVYPM
jgi:hypothetical protein